MKAMMRSLIKASVPFIEQANTVENIDGQRKPWLDCAHAQKMWRYRENGIINKYSRPEIQNFKGELWIIQWQHKPQIWNHRQAKKNCNRGTALELSIDNLISASILRIWYNVPFCTHAQSNTSLWLCLMLTTAQTLLSPTHLRNIITDMYLSIHNVSSQSFIILLEL